MITITPNVEFGLSAMSHVTGFNLVEIALQFLNSKKTGVISPHELILEKDFDNLLQAINFNKIELAICDSNEHTKNKT